MSADFCKSGRISQNQENPKYARAYLMRARAYDALGDNDHAKADSRQGTGT